MVLLDEQMPGRRGLEIFQAIRAVDHSMPVVMVTKSEEQETLKDAIGAEISDYLIKPVNPRQILSVVTRLLEGDRIRQQRLSRDFATRFRELDTRRGQAMAWREWVELIAELAEWEVKLGAADEPGLQDALRTLQDSLRQDFANFLGGTTGPGSTAPRRTAPRCRWTSWRSSCGPRSTPTARRCSWWWTACGSTSGP